MLPTTSLHHADVSTAASEVISNAKRLIAAGCFLHASQSLRLLVESDAWRVSKRGSLAQTLEDLLPQVCALAGESSPKLTDVAAMTKAELAVWAEEQGDEYLAQLAMVTRIQRKPAGAGWTEEKLLALPALPATTRTAAYRDFLHDAEFVMKARLEGVSKLASPMGGLADFMADLKAQMPSFADAGLDALFGGMAAPIKVADEAARVSTMSIARLAVQGCAINGAYSYIEQGVFEAAAVIFVRDGDEASAAEALGWLISTEHGVDFLPRLAMWKPMSALLEKGVLRSAMQIDDRAARDYLAALQTRRKAEKHGAGASAFARAASHAALVVDFPQRIGQWAGDAGAQGDVDERVYLGEPVSPKLERMFADKTLSTKGATAADIAALEKRLKVTLPPSYKAFLAASDGLLVADQVFNFLPAEDVRWFAQDNQDWIDAWGGDHDELDDERYFTYGADQDCVWMRNRYLQTALQASDTSDGDVVLLNPEIKFGDEWEAWLFGNKLPGAIRYRSFAELMEAQVFNRDGQ